MITDVRRKFHAAFTYPIAVLLLSPVIVSETKKYINNLDATDDTPVPVVQTGKK